MSTQSHPSGPSSDTERRPAQIKYRPDIDGLRGISVLAVIGYHAFPQWVRSGFIGVDIFFVISGFLITRIILGGLTRGSFSFVTFYQRRIRRIFPALLLVLVGSFVFGWFMLFPDELKQLGKHIAGAAGFSSNFVLWSEAGYFDNAAQTKPLLHLWSLGIEEQFYLVWPLLLWGAWKNRINPLGLCVIVIGASFAINLYAAHQDMVKDFYSPLARAWELILGSSLAAAGFARSFRRDFTKDLEKVTSPETISGSATTDGAVLRGGATLFGILLIGVAVFVIPHGVSFPGWWALPPAFGAFLIVWAGPNTWLNHRVLSNRLLVAVGLISYPLYLWHWPLLTFARLAEGETPSPAIRIGLVCVGFLLAWLTYQWIERPIRFGAHGKIKAACLLLPMIGIGGAGYYVFNNNGFPARLGNMADFAAYFENAAPGYAYSTAHHIFDAYRCECDFYDTKNARVNTRIAESCYTPRTEHSLFIWGDSHAQQLYYGLSKTLPESISILQVATSGCIPSLTDLGSNSLGGCNESNSFALKVIAERKPQTVLLARSAGHLSEDFDAIAKRLKSLGVRHVLLVGPVPAWHPQLYKVIMNEFWLSTPRRSFQSLDKDPFETDKALKERYTGDKDLTYISLIDVLCDSSGCLIYLGNDRREGIVTHDVGHLLPIASEYLSRQKLAKAVLETFPELEK